MLKWKWTLEMKKKCRATKQIIRNGNSSGFFCFWIEKCLVYVSNFTVQLFALIEEKNDSASQTNARKQFDLVAMRAR